MTRVTTITEYDNIITMTSSDQKAVTIKFQNDDAHMVYVGPEGSYSATEHEADAVAQALMFMGIGENRC